MLPCTVSYAQRKQLVSPCSPGWVLGSGGKDFSTDIYDKSACHQQTVANDDIFEMTSSGVARLTSRVVYLRQMHYVFVDHVVGL